MREPSQSGHLKHPKKSAKVEILPLAENSHFLVLSACSVLFFRAWKLLLLTALFTASPFPAC